MELLAVFVMEFVFAAIGWFCLLVWYRDRKKIQQIKNDQYAGHYSGAGRIFVLNFVAGIGAITMFGMVILILILSVYRYFND